MIYLDNAATTFPKPPGTARALQQAVKRPHGNPGRGGHPASTASAEVVYALREALCAMFGLDDPCRAVLTKNATEALCLAILGILDGGEGVCDVLTDPLEHNSVLRPLYHLQSRGRVRLNFFLPGKTPEETSENFAAAITPSTRMVVVTCAANTTGEHLPVKAISRAAHRAGALVVADASQSAGHENVTFSSTGADYICLPAHKGLYGIMGLGALLIAGTAPVPEPILFGGSGAFSASPEMPPDLPERLEAGTLPVPAAAAWLAGLNFVSERGAETIGARERTLADHLRLEAEEARYTVYGTPGSTILLLNHPRLTSEELAARLADRGIAVRGGLHCAPLAHAFLGTGANGAVRFSFGAFNTEYEVRRTAHALREIAREV